MSTSDVSVVFAFVAGIVVGLLLATIIIRVTIDYLDA